MAAVHTFYLKLLSHYDIVNHLFATEFPYNSFPDTLC